MCRRQGSADESTGYWEGPATLKRSMHAKRHELDRTSFHDLCGGANRTTGVYGVQNHAIRSLVFIPVISAARSGKTG